MKKGAFLLGLVGLLGSLAGLWIAGCGNFTLDPETSGQGFGFRRLYVNDGAAADSLTPALVSTGVKFVLQPGKNYQISVATSRTDDRLQVSYLSHGASGSYQTIPARVVGGREVFNLASDRGEPQFFLGQLLVNDGIGAINSLGHVSLASMEALGSDTLNLRLIFVRKLTRLPDSTAKIDFANKFFQYLAFFFNRYGIVVKGSYEIVEPTAKALVFPFSNAFVSLPGKRIVNHAHFYLVDSISIGNPKSGLVGQVLGFAPREVLDLDMDKESRVVLANPYSLGTTVSKLATTAAHEMGHFFGLRHTVSTRHDLLQDQDSSNIEDGFTDTKACDLDQALAKKGMVELNSDSSPIGQTAFCFRMADNSCNSQVCDLGNLMHPVDCFASGLYSLSPEQVAFLKKNLATYRH